MPGEQRLAAGAFENLDRRRVAWIYFDGPNGPIDYHRVDAE